MYLVVKFSFFFNNKSFSRMIFSHALTSRPIVGEMTAAIGKPSAAPTFSKTSIGDEIIAEPSAVPAFPINGTVDEIIAEPSAVPAFQSKGLSEAKDSFSDGTITFFFISLLIFPKVK